jgi:hypothetical protein
MYIRGSGVGQEFKRNDTNFYRGIVMKNDDPLALNRVKVYISEISNQPYDEWFDKFENINVKVAGENNIGDSWKDTKIFDDIAIHIPWAEPCYPIMGESGSSRYYKDGKVVTISDCNYTDGFVTIDENPPTLEDGSFSPAMLFENKDTAIGDAFSTPMANLCGKCNPYSFLYRSDSHVNKAKGVFGIPEVGSKVWVFFWQGDPRFPVYFGTTRDYRELTLINNTDRENNISVTYPTTFES